MVGGLHAIRNLFQDMWLMSPDTKLPLEVFTDFILRALGTLGTIIVLFFLFLIVFAPVYIGLMGIFSE